MGTLPYRDSEKGNSYGEPRVVARTDTTNSSPEDAQNLDSRPLNEQTGASVNGNEATIFKHVQWSPDGTTVLTSSEDRTLRTFILPPELLEGTSPYTLRPYSIHHAPSPVYATAIQPSYSLSDPSTALYIASPAALPIRLLSPFSPSILGSYPLIHAPTERYVTPHALLFSSLNPNQFIAGSDSLLSIFDISRPSEGPVVSLRTIPSKRNPQVGGGVGMKGIVSALALNPIDGMLAAGTFTRWLGLYDSAGAGDAVAVFPLSSPLDVSDNIQDGQGVTSLHWSSCGRYLAVAERGSAAVAVWDIRGTGQRLAWLVDRRAASMQQLGVAVRAGSGSKHVGHDSDPASSENIPVPETAVGDDLWAGNTDGSVSVWTGLGMREGHVQPAWSFRAHDDAIGGLDLHPWGDVLATCSGARHYQEQGAVDEESGSEAEAEVEDETKTHTVKSLDCSLRIWAL